MNLEPEPCVVILEEEGKPEDRVELALNCLPQYDPSCWNGDSTPSFRYWKIRDYAYAYRSKRATPSMVSSMFFPPKFCLFETDHLQNM